MVLFSYYYIGCSQNQTKTIFFEDVISVLPRDLAKLKTNSASSLVTHEMIPSSPIYSNGDLFETACRKSEKISQKINVLLIQIGSMSSNHFRRMFPLVYDYLSSNSVIFENFMTIGNDSRSNTMSLLTGATIREEFYYNFDVTSLPLVLKDFQELGHFTMYNEDDLENGKELK
jgi:hypothetical protein